MLRRGDAVTVWNRTASKAQALERFGATAAASPAAAVHEAERVHMTLSDDAAVDDVLSRRIPLLLVGAQQGLDVVDRAAEIAGARLGWSTARREQEMARYKKSVDDSRRFRNGC